MSFSFKFSYLQGRGIQRAHTVGGGARLATTPQSPLDENVFDVSGSLELSNGSPGMCTGDPSATVDSS